MNADGMPRELAPAIAVRQIVCRIDELKPHPGWCRLNLRPPTARVSALAERGELVLQEPIAITRERLVVDGYARIELARLQRRQTILCNEYDWNEEQALVRLIQLHGRAQGLNDFVRASLALEAEPWLQHRARVNRQRGGQLKGLSKLTEAERIDVRKQLAIIANVCAGNIEKTRCILRSAHPQIIGALRNGEVKIDRAWKWSKQPHNDQLRLLEELHNNRGITRTIRRLVAQHTAARRNTETVSAELLRRLLSHLISLPDLSVVPASLPVNVICVSSELLKSLPAQGSLEGHC